ncbi:MAG: bifunctional YncE family protein/alkaline phosphatase family protein [Terriglobales bacterium]
MRTRVFVILAALLLIAAALLAIPGRNRISLPTSKVLIQPVPGNPQPMNTFPVNIQISPDQNYAAILEAGYGDVETNVHQSIAVLDFATNQITRFADPRLGHDAHQSYFIGLAWSSDGRHLYAPIGSTSDPEGKKPGDTGNGIAVYAFNNGKIAPERWIPIPPQPLAPGKKRGTIHKDAPDGKLVPWPAGIAVIKGDKGDQLLVADNLSDNVLLMDAESGKIIHRFDLSTGKYVPSSYPYGVVTDNNGTMAWVSLWNSSSLVELELSSGRIFRRIDLTGKTANSETGPHPTAMAWGPNGLLFVALSNSDEVAVVYPEYETIVDYLSTSLPGQEFRGAFPNALAVSADGHRLYVANASSDAVAVFGIEPWIIRTAMSPPDEHPRVLPTQTGPLSKGLTKPLGFIPTDWYPTALAVRGSELLIASGKGHGTGPNNIPQSKDNPAGRKEGTYIATLLQGSLARVDLKQAESHLKELTAEVLESNLMNGPAGGIPFAGGVNPIKHVIYIIKENRTYDQIFGDLGVGNGDRSLTMYGEDITPNQHALARQFGVIDNFYDSGEVSGDGHLWSNAAITSDYTEKTWQINYRGGERSYDYEGVVALDYPIKLGIPDVNEPSTGYLWTNLARHGKTYRHYGEYISTHFCDRGGDADMNPQQGTPLAMPESCSKAEVKPGEPLPRDLGDGRAEPNPYPWPIPLVAENVATKPELVGHFDPHYPDFRLEFPDQLRVDEFLREFRPWAEKRAKMKRDEMPQFMQVRLPNDHTVGTTPGKPTPAASIADNDLAVGRVVEAISNSPYWNDTAIFILEDDAQDGADHVDAHRSTALVISKYGPKNFDIKPIESGGDPTFGHPRQGVFVDSHFYTTVSMIRTMEVLLGLRPMNNNDAQAPVMAPLFTGPGTQPPFKADYRNRDNRLIYTANKKDAVGAKESAKMNFTHADAVDTALLNQILWRDRMGARPMPLVKHTVIPDRPRDKDDDD